MPEFYPRRQTGGRIAYHSADQVVKGWVGVTDFDWYSFLARSATSEEVNFWQPSGGQAFRAVGPGEPFFFKLKAPRNAIAGFGLFARHSVLPDWLAWEAFGEANGAPDYDTFRRLLDRNRARDRSRPGIPYDIGCIIVSECVFFAPDDWVAQPRDWRRNIVRGKTYDLSAGEGRRIWEACLERAASLRPGMLVGEGAPRFGTPQLVRPRLGQGGFRVAVTDAYERACAVTREHSLPVLEAAHIRPYSEGGEHRVSNGLLLRTDLHRLFDRGYVTITPEFKFEVSRQLREEWHNGRTYYELHGREVWRPPGHDEQPDRALLSWHNETLYRG